MPTYDYSCEKCGLKFELRLKFSDEVDQPCVDVDCGSVAKRQFSAVPIVFKGSGWYVNDYGKKGSSSGKSGDSATSETESTSSTEKSQQIRLHLKNLVRQINALKILILVKRDPLQNEETSY